MTGPEHYLAAERLQWTRVALVPMRACSCGLVARAPVPVPGRGHRGSGSAGPSR